jgi:hypothetical protein
VTDSFEIPFPTDIKDNNRAEFHTDMNASYCYYYSYHCYFRFL